MRLSAVAMIGACCLLLAGCSGEVSFQVGGKDPQDAAQDRIESQEFTDQVGLGPLGAECNDPGDVEEGDVFLCTATTDDDRNVEVTATIVDDDTLNVRTTNVVLASDVPRVADLAVRLLNEQNGLGFPPGTIDCGTESVVLAGDQTMPCVLNNPGDGRSYDTVITMVDRENGRISVDVAGTPRAQ